MYSKKFFILEVFFNVYKIFLGIIFIKYVGLVIGVYRSLFVRFRGWGDLLIIWLFIVIKVKVFLRKDDIIDIKIISSFCYKKL